MHSIMGIRVLGALDRLNDVIERLRVEQVICSGDPVEPGALQNALRLCAARSVPVRELVFEIREPAMTASGGTP
jgi:FlaA1/EpsC-like NDP-sugar epimerase